MQKTKHLLSICAVVLFAILALSSKVNKIHYGAFNYSNNVEDKSETGNYIVKNDNTKIYGKKISWKAGLLSKEQIQIDDQKFKISEIKGYHQGENYYSRLGKGDYIRRIVHGKINIYVMFTDVSTTTTDRNGFSRTRNYTRTDQYSQKGEDGQLIGMANQDDMKKLVSDCPAAVQMLELSNKKMRKAIRKDPNYLNSVFEMYNNGCKPTNTELSKN